MQPRVIKEIPLMAYIKTPEEVVKQLTEVYKEKFIEIDENYLPVYDLLSLYVRNIKSHHLKHFKLVIYSSLDADIQVIDTSDIQLLESNLVPAQGQYIKSSYDLRTAFRLIFSLIKPHPIEVEIAREDDLITVYYKHEVYYDIFKHYRDFISQTSHLVESELMKVLYDESGFINLLAIPSNKALIDELELDCIESEGCTKVTIRNKRLLSDFEYQSVTIRAESFQSLEELIEGQVGDIFSYEESETDIEFTTSILFEVISNFLLHDGADQEMYIRKYKIEDEMYTLLNHSFANNTNIKLILFKKN